MVSYPFDLSICVMACVDGIDPDISGFDDRIIRFSLFNGYSNYE